MRPQLSIIIVNYRSVQLIVDCLHSIYQHSDMSGVEVLIIDNSNDDHAPVTSQFPGVQWVPMNYNAGFARANNAGNAPTTNIHRQAGHPPACPITPVCSK